MTLMLHVNATEVPYDGLRQLETPLATQSHVPIPHFRVVDLVKSTVGMFGHEVVAEHHGVTEDGARYFGLLSLRSTYTGYEDTVGLRNSHDKSFPIGVAFGSRVFVCDNLAFIADQSIKRRHTANLKAHLPGLIGELIEPLALHREAQHRTFERYKLQEWLTFINGEIHKTFGPLFHGANAEVRKATIDAITKRFAFVEKALAGRQFLLGDKFTAADVYVGSHIGFGLQFGTVEKRPAFEKYWARISARPAAVKAREIDDKLAAELAPPKS